MNKYTSFIFALVFTAACSDAAPFDERSWPKEVIQASWERIIARPEVYRDSVIVIDGWFHVTNDMGIAIFKDKEAITLGRPQSYVVIDPKEDLILAYKKGDKAAWKGLRLRYVEITCRFQGVSDAEAGRVGYVGKLLPPFSIYFPPTTKKNSDRLTICPDGQDWRRDGQGREPNNETHAPR
jgi:hypothetical protein